MHVEHYPEITVFTLVYNTGDYVIKALESVRANNYPNIQHIIIDDLSTDGSVETLKKWINANNYNCEYIQHERNMGICKSLNEVLRRARGKYLFGVSDDLVEPDRIRVQVGLMESLGDGVGAVYSDAWLVRDEKRLSKTFMEYFNPGFVGNMPQGDMTVPILRGFYVPAISVMVRKEAYDFAGPFDESLDYEDADMWIRISSRYRFAYDNTIVATYRLHENSYTVKNRVKLCRSFFTLYQKHVGSNPEHRRWWNLKLNEIAENYYLLEGESSARWLLFTFRNTGSIRSLYFALTAALGISHQNALSLFGLRKSK
jgi:glycosyltransferase involved in cell wall biosynthesis